MNRGRRDIIARYWRNAGASERQRNLLILQPVTEDEIAVEAAADDQGRKSRCA
jgi:hypothetical protein